MTRAVDLDERWAIWPVAAVRGAGMPVDWLARLAGDAGERRATELLGEPPFLAALTWQNPAVARDQARRTQGRLLGRYAQRYCAKNDSIGFFGAVGWARLAPAHPGDAAVTGSGGIRSGDVYFERWAIQALATAWQRDQALFPHLPVRTHPAVSRSADVVSRPRRRPLPLDPGQALILDNVDGTRPAGQVAAAAGERGLTMLRDLEREGVLLIGFTVPPGEHPERDLRSQVARIPDQAARERMLGQLDLLESLRRDAADAIADPARLDPALAGLDRAFAGLSGGCEPARTKPAASSGRTIVYPDCRRDLDVLLGQPLLEQLRTPLCLLAASARWFTAQLAEACAEQLHADYLALRGRQREVRLSDLYFAAAAFLSGQRGGAVDEIADDFVYRWAEVLEDATEAGDEARLHGDKAAGVAAALFQASRPGWAAARNHSPDLLLARTPQGLRWVLGELHMAMNTLENRFFHTVCDDPAELAAHVAADMADGRVVPCYPAGESVDSRRYPPLAVDVPGRYLYWSYGEDPGAPGGARCVPATALRISRRDGELMAGPDDDDWALPVVEFFGEFLSVLAVNRFRLREPRARLPRLLIDDVVVARRSWLFRAGELPGGVVTRHGYNAGLLGRHLLDLGLPRYVFVRGPDGGKPMFTDLHAPVLVANLARTWRALTADAAVCIEEMLPDPAELWLADEEGLRYTTEFRFVLTDKSPGRVLRIPAAPGAASGRR